MCEWKTDGWEVIHLFMAVMVEIWVKMKVCICWILADGRNTWGSGTCGCEYNMVESIVMRFCIFVRFVG